MIKVIAFDMGGVLITEKDISLSPLENEIERTFGRNNSDEEFVNNLSYLKKSKDQILRKAKKIIFKLYEIKYPNLFNEIKNINPDIKICIATNHITAIKEYIEKSFDMNLINNVFISAEMHVSKPDVLFYKKILQELQCEPHELLFVDDRAENTSSAESLGIQTILLNKESNLLDEIKKCI